MTTEDIPTMRPVTARDVNATSLAKKREADHAAALKRKPQYEGRPQPLATRHLDPRHNPDLIDAEGGVQLEGQGSQRYMLRKGYHFFRGETDAYEGPQWIYVHPSEIIGQEWKFDMSILPDAPAASVALSSPVGVDVDMGAVERRERMAKLESQLAVLRNEEALAEKEKEKAIAVRDDPRSIQTPEANPEADKMPMTTEGSPAAAPSSESSLPTASSVDESAAVGGSGNAGVVTSPAANPEAADADKPKPRRGRPPGATSKVGRVTVKD